MNFAMNLALMLGIFFARIAWPVEQIQFGTPSATNLSKDINIAVWNIYKCKKKEFFEEYKTLTDNVDIVLIQEMLLTDDFKAYFEEDQNFVYQMAVSFKMPFSDVATGVTTGSRLLPFETIPLKSIVTEPMLTPKSAIISKFKIDGDANKVLTVVNIHAINFVTNGALEKHLMQVFEKIKDLNGPLIFAGDFNSWTDAKEQVMYRIMNQLGLTEVKFKVDNRIKFNGHYLDHIFYRGLRLLDSTTRGEEYKGSDHRPMVASFEFLDI